MHKVILILFLYCQTFASVTVNVFSAEIQTFNTQQKNSLYNKFLSKLEKASTAKFVVKYLPPLRAKEEFKNSNGCFFPLSLGDNEARNSRFLLSRPLGEILLYGVRAKSFKAEVKESESFSYLSIYSKGVNFSKNARSYEIEKADQLFGMLDRKRVDYIYVSIPDVYFYFALGKEDFDKKYYVDKSIPVKVVKDYFACKPVKNNRMVISKINRVL